MAKQEEVRQNVEELQNLINSDLLSERPDQAKSHGPKYEHPRVPSSIIVAGRSSLTDTKACLSSRRQSFGQSSDAKRSVHRKSVANKPRHCGCFIVINTKRLTRVIGRTASGSNASTSSTSG